MFVSLPRTPHLSGTPGAATRGTGLARSTQASGVCGFGINSQSPHIILCKEPVGAPGSHGKEIGSPHGLHSLS